MYYSLPTPPFIYRAVCGNTRMEVTTMRLTTLWQRARHVPNTNTWTGTREISSRQSHLLEVKNSALLSYPPSLPFPLPPACERQIPASLVITNRALLNCVFLFCCTIIRPWIALFRWSCTREFDEPTTRTYLVSSWTFFRRTPRQLNRRSCPSCKGHVYGKLRSCKQDVRRR